VCVILSPDWALPAFADFPDRCFICGKDVNRSFPVVGWSGYDDLILLHPECAERLGAHLIADAREAELAAGIEHR
jgi:hypothetical protein